MRSAWIAVLALAGCNQLFSLSPTKLVDAFSRPEMACDEQGVANLDEDGDGVVNGMDNCPGIYNPDQADRDGDHVGDVCDPNPDTGGDSIVDVTYFQTGLGCWVPDTIANWNLATTPGDVTSPATGTATLTIGFTAQHGTIEVGVQPPAQLPMVSDIMEVGLAQQQNSHACRIAYAVPQQMFADPGGSYAGVTFTAGYHHLRLSIDATGATCDFDGAIATNTMPPSGDTTTSTLYTHMTNVGFAYTVIYSSPAP